MEEELLFGSLDLRSTAQYYDCVSCCKNTTMLIAGCVTIPMHLTEYGVDVPFVDPKRIWNLFICPNCKQIQLLETTSWYYLEDPDDVHNDETLENSELVCHDYSTTQVLYPVVDIAVPLPHSDLPDALRDIYMEARKVHAVSPRSAAALLRLLIEKLCNEILDDGQKSETIYGMIGKLRDSQKISVTTQNALDSIRIIGNDAIHKGVIYLNDNSEISSALFDFVNYITNGASLS